ncbi:hypothetical protein Tco_0688519 [Tanacetum coccineum]
MKPIGAILALASLFLLRDKLRAWNGRMHYAFVHDEVRPEFLERLTLWQFPKMSYGEIACIAHKLHNGGPQFEQQDGASISKSDPKFVSDGFTSYSKRKLIDPQVLERHACWSKIRSGKLSQTENGISINAGTRDRLYAKQFIHPGNSQGKGLAGSPIRFLESRRIVASKQEHRKAISTLRRLDWVRLLCEKMGAFGPLSPRVIGFTTESSRIGEVAGAELEQKLVLLVLKSNASGQYLKFSNIRCQQLGGRVRTYLATSCLSSCLRTLIIETIPSLIKRFIEPLLKSGDLIAKIRRFRGREKLVDEFGYKIVPRNKDCVLVPIVWVLEQLSHSSSICLPLALREDLPEMGILYEEVR